MDKPRSMSLFHIDFHRSLSVWCDNESGCSDGLQQSENFKLSYGKWSPQMHYGRLE